MTKVHAIFEKGVFRPVEPVKIGDGARVELTIEESTEAASAQLPLSALIEIANLPLEGNGEAFSGVDHDRVLYGEKSGR